MGAPDVRLPDAGHARLIETMARLPQVCKYLDMPLQHGHPETLRRMSRPNDVDRVRRLIGDLRAAMPDIALRTTFIVGFPGETEAEFQTLLDFIEEIAVRPRRHVHLLARRGHAGARAARPGPRESQAAAL